MNTNKKICNTPDAIIIGAQKCGTSTLHNSLISHSNIQGPIDAVTNEPMKEIDFFCDGKKWDKGINWYFSNFPQTSKLKIDSSPNYLANPFCYKRIASVIPDVKIIICLRNPVDRAYSQYNHYSQLLPNTKHWDWIHDVDFFTNINLEFFKINNFKGRDIDLITNYAGIVTRGIYIEQINHLLRYFKRSKIYVTIMDNWDINYEAELNNILLFLGQEKEKLVNTVEHKRIYEVKPISKRERSVLKDFYMPFNESLFDFLGFGIPEWG